ncbi:hypothetical protein ACHHYP_12412 [Achlya hypogyna]|uniref:Secreted protein n=1 Tax=Achlya hypogyna TaxID=1202772 RepID=A0A0A7CPF2_ACHHY|nr:secreted protein [Achlya hypogyna]OQR85041.1 hypothetical protein ACHHYP_12412 [Achlya hypogyna]
MQVKFLIGVLAGVAATGYSGQPASGYNSKPATGYGNNNGGYGNQGGYGDHDGYDNKGGYGQGRDSYGNQGVYDNKGGYGQGRDGYDNQGSYGGNSGYGNKGGYDRDGYGNQGGYGGNSGYGNKGGYGGYGKPQTYVPPTYVPYQNHYKVDNTAPYPYTYFTSPHKKHDLSIPKLGDHHCFLTGAPWTTCGRKSLTSYFLDQCLVFYVQMSANVNGICGGKPPKPTPEPTAHNDDYYSRDYVTPEPTPKPTHKPKPTNGGYGSETEAPAYYGWSGSSDDSDSGDSSDSYDSVSGAGVADASSPAYLQEKCYQTSFVSITTATVMCLTENYIRVNFIEHYASRACGNPIEGPILYLKKLHAFIEEVKKCTGNAAADNYPNLYRTFKTCDGISYNPNAPFYLDSNKHVTTSQYTSGEASGLAAYTVGKKFLCANVNALDENGDYLAIPSNNHYGALMTKGGYFSCESSAAFTKLGYSNVVRSCKDVDTYTSDMELRNLYDSVHYVETVTTSLRRPLTIAEIAVRSAGVHEQPILEGFGIMYYCGFYACVANHDGDSSKCYPEFNSEKDWELPLTVSYSSLLTDSRHINECIEDGYLTNEDITGCEEVATYIEALSSRSYLCLAENEIVRFLGEIYSDWAACEDDAISLVYGRHLADERCYASRLITKDGEITFDSTEGDTKKQCLTKGEIYPLLNKALGSLKDKCHDNKTAPKPEPHSEPEPAYKHGNKYGDNYGSTGNNYGKSNHGAYKQPVYKH